MSHKYKHLIRGKLYRLSKELYIATPPYNLCNQDRRILKPGEIILITEISYKESYHEPLLILSVLHKFGWGRTTGTHTGSANGNSIMTMEPLPL